jgi:outer membrane biosynthesis protein TonB
MKKLILPVMFLAILAGLYEQSKERPNIYIQIVALVVFMYGMMQLSAKTPSKHSEPENDEEDAN